MLTPAEQDRLCLHETMTDVYGVITTGDAWHVVTFGRAPAGPQCWRDRQWLGQIMRLLGFRRVQRRLDGVRQHAYARGTTRRRIVTRPDRHGVPRPAVLDPDHDFDRGPGFASDPPGELESHGLVTARHARRIIARARGREPSNVELGATMRAAGFRHTRRRFDGVRLHCYTRKPGTPDPAALPAALRAAHGVLAARDAARLGATRHALRRAGWRRTRARLDGERQTVYVRPHPGDEHVWPSGLPRVAGTASPGHA